MISTLPSARSPDSTDLAPALGLRLRGAGVRAPVTTFAPRGLNLLGLLALLGIVAPLWSCYASHTKFRTGSDRLVQHAIGIRHAVELVDVVVSEATPPWTLSAPPQAFVLSRIRVELDASSVIMTAEAR